MSLIGFLLINSQAGARKPETNGTAAQGENSKYVPFHIFMSYVSLINHFCDLIMFSFSI